MRERETDRARKKSRSGKNPPPNNDEGYHSPFTMHLLQMLKQNNKNTSGQVFRRSCRTRALFNFQAAQASMPQKISVGISKRVSPGVGFEFTSVVAKQRGLKRSCQVHSTAMLLFNVVVLFFIFDFRRGEKDVPKKPRVGGGGFFWGNAKDETGGRVLSENTSKEFD